MAEGKGQKDFNNYGYADERFETVLTLSDNLHCAICSNVFKDPVMCKNEHCFCRGCITEHLKNFKNCPCCNQDLSVRSLTDAPRIVRNLLSELRIRCDYHERGCEDFVQLGNLPGHVETCGFRPVACTNAECSREINIKDQARHESEECRFRKVKCRSCKEMDLMVQEIGASLGGLCEQVVSLNNNALSGLTAVESRLGEIESRFENVESRLEKVESTFDKVENKFEKVESSLEKVESGLGKVESSNEGMGSRFESVESQLVKMRDQQSSNVQHSAIIVDDKEPSCSNQATQVDLTTESKDVKGKRTILVAGGHAKYGTITNSVEIYDTTTNSWKNLEPMKKHRAEASSIVYKGQVIVAGGISENNTVLSSIEQLCQNSNPFAPAYWSSFPVSLPRALRGHHCALYDDKLIVIGGYDEEGKQSDMIYEILLCLPFTTKVLAKLPLSTFPLSTLPTGCGIVLVDDKVLIFGGLDSYLSTANVTMYDITKNEVKKLAPLLYAVSNMATVRFGENVILAGGSKKSVINYNIETQKSHMLPPMKSIRSYGAAAVDVNSMVVIGGYQHKENQRYKRLPIDLCSVERYDFASAKWNDLPPMNEGRWGFIAQIV